jgi:hypothetical protein
MGLGGFTSGGNATFLTIGMGADEKGRPRAVIGRRAKQGDPGAVQVFKKENDPALDKDGNPVYRTEYLFIEGTVTKIERKPGFDEKPDGKLAIYIGDASGEYCLELNKTTSSGKVNEYWLDFALRCDDIDWSKPVRFSPYSIPDEREPKYSNKHLVPSQGGQKIMKKYKIKWLREPGAELDPNQPPPFTYDADEGAWRKGKTLRWLEDGPIQRAIDKVAFLNGAPSGINDGFDSLGKVPIENQQEVYGDGAPPIGVDDMPFGEDDDVPFL